MSWEPTNLSEFLTERNGRIKYESANQLGLQRIKKIDFSGNIHLDAETDTKTDMIRVKSGDLVISGINAAKGAIAVHAEDEDVLATIHYSAYEFNADRISVEFLKWFFKSPEFAELLKEQIPGGIKTELKPKHILPLQVKLPKLSEQITVADRLHRFRLEQLKLEHEISQQESLLDKLKQAILQEAIQGKLTADWRAAHPDVEPARQLLHRIQAEKARLIAAKKLRPEKPLPRIIPAEIPFEIPKDWEWCRFGSYARFERGKFSARPRNDKRFFGGPYPFIQIGSLDSHGSVITSCTQTLNEAGLEVSKMFEAGTIAVAIVGGTIGNLGVLGLDMCFTDSLVGIRPSKLTCQDFILLLMRSKQPKIQSVAYQRAGQPNISLPNLTDILIPLPPLAEQAAIVEQVEGLMTICRALEAEIEHARTHAAHLLQAVLKEAFAPAANSVAAPAE
jgi:type I restriction enzyme S subunit